MQSAAWPDLPTQVLLQLCNHILHDGNAGDIARLMMVDAATYAALASQDGLWHAQCAALGWAADDDATPPPPPMPVRRWGWWFYFCHRMGLRKRVRDTLRRYLAFLGPAGNAAMLPGCKLAALGACQARLALHGLTMPWELWEVYRAHNGQASHLPTAAFFNGSRFLPCQDAVLLHCAALEQGGGLADPSLLEVSTPERGGRCYAVSLVDGSVWWVAGFASRKLTTSFVELLQKLLS